MSCVANRKAFLSITTKNSIMASIDDDLMENGLESSYCSTAYEEQPAKRIEKPKHKQWIEMVLKIIHYLIDVGMVMLSGFMMEMGKVFPLVFSVGLIIWLSYRIFYFKRSDIIDAIIGIFLFVATALFYIILVVNNETGYHEEECFGVILIPTVYLVFFCVWGAIRRKHKGL